MLKSHQEAKEWIAESISFVLAGNLYYFFNEIRQRNRCILYFMINLIDI